jgi:beta-glucuronidase
VGGFTPFAFEVTGKLKAENSLVVRVNDQRHLEAVPTTNTDWWNYGGLTRDVSLVEVPATFISDYSVKLERGQGDRASISVQLDGRQKQQQVHFRIAELGIDQTLTTDANGYGSAEIALPHLQRWSPKNPHLYAVEFQAETDRINDRVGFRTIETRGREILLNGEPIFLRGVSIHEENPLRGGRAATVEDARLLLNWAKELGCNFARLAHYPHNEYMARTADEMGILLWEEIPVYWTIQWENPNTLANARNQLAELITRDHNRASVMVWSVANETPISEPRTKFLKTLVDDARHLDGTRLVSAAMEMRKDPNDPNTRIIDDPFGEYTDLVSFNEYIGWYDGLPESCRAAKWSVLREKPVVISEFGGDALGGLHGDVHARFTEEFQAQLYRESIPMLQRLPGFSGCTPWVLTDFRSPRRPLPHIQDGFNRKGLVSENGTKKEAFYVLKAFYDEKAKSP